MSKVSVSGGSGGGGGVKELKVTWLDMDSYDYLYFSFDYSFVPVGKAILAHVCFSSDITQQNEIQFIDASIYIARKKDGSFFIGGAAYGIRQILNLDGSYYPATWGVNPAVVDSNPNSSFRSILNGFMRGRKYTVKSAYYEEVR